MYWITLPLLIGLIFWGRKRFSAAGRFLAANRRVVRLERKLSRLSRTADSVGEELKSAKDEVVRLSSYL